MRRPILVYDGDCGFCRRWVARLKRRTGRRVAYRPLADRRLLARLGIRRRQALHAAQLVEPDGRRFQGAAAIYRAIEHAPGRHRLARALRSPGLRLASEAVYRVIADHRIFFSRLDRWLYGQPLRDDPRWLTERATGVVWWLAFRSLRRQVLGLWGERGILPIREYLEAARAQLPPRDRLRLVPSLFWLDASDAQLERACEAGEWTSLCLALDVFPHAAALASWLLYLSFVSAGRDFLGFQWDVLLLEAGLLIAIGAPTWMFRWLVFRLYFESGLAKLKSGDPSWRTGTALRFYYETAPLPTRLGWWAHQLPPRVQGWSTALAVMLELGAPFFVFLPRRPRLIGLGILSGLQVAFAATSNYGFFNLLTVALSMSLLPARLPRRRSRLARLAGALASLPLLALSASRLLRRLGWRRRTRPGRPNRLDRLAQLAAPFCCVNPYGLFAQMTLDRPEIVVEGSNDGVTWKPYEFRFKPGPPERAPGRVAPHQPRLDWQMWFAALTRPPSWFVSFLARLLEGAPEVRALLAHDPFPARPPHYVRASLYDYRMTDRKTRKRTGDWWTRRRLGTYFPPATRAE
jgi:predicted DCC family thiol-disulfide oxidoreductase YuxK